MKCYGENIVMLGIPSSRQNFPALVSKETPFPVPIRYSGHAHFSGRGLPFPPFLRTHVPFHACPSAKRKEEEKKSPYTQHSFPHSPPPSPHILCLFLLTWAPSRKKGVLPPANLYYSRFFADGSILLPLLFFPAPHD